MPKYKLTWVVTKGFGELEEVIEIKEYEEFPPKVGYEYVDHTSLARKQLVDVEPYNPKGSMVGINGKCKNCGKKVKNSSVCYCEEE
jgi:hypothetical protein